MRLLLGAGAPVGAEAGVQRSTPLQLAARHGQLGALQALLEAGAPAGARNARGSTALALAAQHGLAAARTRPKLEPKPKI